MLQRLIVIEIGPINEILWQWEEDKSDRYIFSNIDIDIDMYVVVVLLVYNALIKACDFRN